MNADVYPPQAGTQITAVGSPTPRFYCSTGSDSERYADILEGIAPDDQQHLFEDFTQVESPMQVRSRGTGLGLPLSKRLSELLGGRVCVQSEPGKGSTFYASIPVRPWACAWCRKWR